MVMQCLVGRRCITMLRYVHQILVPLNDCTQRDVQMSGNSQDVKLEPGVQIRANPPACSTGVVRPNKTPSAFTNNTSNNGTFMLENKYDILASVST